MNTNEKKQIAVIGAGIVGINCALALQMEGFQVTLVDRSTIGDGCSARNAGHFATEQIFPLADKSLLWQLPKMLLDPEGPVVLSPRYVFKAIPWFISFIKNMKSQHRLKNTAALKTLNKHAISYYLPLLKAANAEYLITVKGSLLVFEKTPLNSITKQFKAFQLAGVAVKLLNREQALQLEPNLSESIQYALYFTDVGHSIDPHKISLALAKLAFEYGATFRQFSVNRIKQKESKVLLSDDNETKSFDKVIVATGAWSKTLLKQLNYNLPIAGERGYSLDLNESSTLSRPIASAERRFIMTPMQHGLRLAGTVEFADIDKEANMKRADILYKNAEHILSDIPKFDPLNAKAEQRWLGIRPSLPDSLPVIGQAPNHKNIYFALGHQHLGLTLGAITGTLIKQTVMGDKTDVNIKPFCISRFN